MTYHRHHHSLCALAFALACLITGSSALLTAQTPEKQPSAHEKMPRAEILRLVGSSKPDDRIAAAEVMASEGMDYDLFWKLMNDKDPEVRQWVIYALDNFCSEKQSDIPIEMARKMAALMEKEVTEERIRAAFDGSKDSKKAEDNDLGLLYASALCLSRLYQTTALIRTPEAYASWQEHVLRSLVFNLVSDRDHQGDAPEEYLYVLLALINDPEVLTHALQLTLENLDDLPTSRQLTALEELWGHPLLGAGKPMNLILLQELAPFWESVRDHILRNLKDKALKERTMALLTHIDTALTQARQQLGEEPAKATQP